MPVTPKFVSNDIVFCWVEEIKLTILEQKLTYESCQYHSPLLGANYAGSIQFQLHNISHNLYLNVNI
jgi:hypothetical protein